MGSGVQEQRASLTQGEVLPISSSSQSEASYEISKRLPTFPSPACSIIRDGYRIRYFYRSRPNSVGTTEYRFT
ncbi:hypothetical protein ATANTOWER_001744 [Ataeniobius toweri]|uniref:Uncharacterized protein n=1 Tax=Ataeniobius toweri TaxID=208326 RepID=A0ABU7BWT9_9TELE|nr:hypothetical protein [Ataeniobius toweri]